MTLNTGILHPGEMGSYLAGAVRSNLDKVYWCSEGRSAATHQRAEKQDLTEITTLNEFCEICKIVISVCPPHAALSQAQAILDCGFQGIYVDANAIAPATVIATGEQMQAAGITFVDGGIIGLPTGKRGDATLYLSGSHAATVAECFTDGVIEVKVLGAEIGQASALKMCYAAWNKGRNALLTAVLAAAEQMNVRIALQQHWNNEDPGFSDHATQRLRSVARKAWRFGPEMDEIATTLRACGVPAQFFDSAAELYRRESAFKNNPVAPSLSDILAAVTKIPDSNT